MSFDAVTIWLRKAVNILFVGNPVGTSLGVLFGVLLDGFIGVFSPAFKAIAWVNFSAIKIFHLVCFGVFSFNIIPYLFRKRMNPEVDKALRLITEQLDTGHISKAQSKLLYLAVVKKVVEEVVVQGAGAKKVDARDDVMLKSKE